MSHVAIVVGPDPGHALNALAVARELVDRGVEVTVATGASHRAAVTDLGARHLDLPLLAPTPGDADVAHLLIRRPAEMAPPLVDLLRPLAPDVIVADVITVVGAFAAEMLGIAWVELSPHILYDADPLVPPVGLGRRPSRRSWRRRSDASIRRAQAESQAEGRRLRDEARRALGLGGDGAPTLRLACTLPGLEHPRRVWPPDAFIVGALDADPALAPLAPPSGTAPLVVVTDTTATGVAGSLSGTALAGLRHAGVRLVVTTGRDDLDPWPEGCVVGRGPHGPLLDAAAVAVAPGGAGFVGKSLMRGVPMLVAPLAGDQRENAARVRHADAGLRLSPRWLTPTTLRLAVERLLTDRRFADGARRVAATADGLGVGVAATLIEEVVAGRRPRADGPMAARDVAG